MVSSLINELSSRIRSHHKPVGDTLRLTRYLLGYLNAPKMTMRYGLRVEPSQIHSLSWTCRTDMAWIDGNHAGPESRASRADQLKRSTARASALTSSQPGPYDRSRPRQTDQRPDNAPSQPAVPHWS